MQDSSVLQVVIFREGNLVGTEVFLPGAYTLGSDPDCELLLADGAVAGRHALLSFKDGRISVEDLTGQGVQVNGAPVSLWEIGARDDVAIGPFLIKVRPVSQKRPASRPSPAAPAQAAAVPVRPAVLPAQHPPAAVPPRPAAHPAPFTPPARPVAARPVVPQTVAPVAPARPAPPLVAPPPAPSAVERMAQTVRHSLPQAVPTTVVTEEPTLETRLDTTESGVELRSVAGQPLPTLKEIPQAVAPAPVAAAPLPAHAQPRAAASRSASAAAPVQPAASGKKPGGPFLRVRVIWGGDYVVGLHGFAFGGSVEAGPGERCDVPLYHPAFPKAFTLAAVKDGLWTVSIPGGCRAQVEGARGWEQVGGTSVPLAAGRGLRIALGRGQALELRSEPPPPAAPMRLTDLVDPRMGLPLLVVATAVIAGILMMPDVKKQEAADFTPKQLAPIRALLKPPDKKQEKKIQEKIAKLTNREVKPVKEAETVAPPQKARASVSKAVKAVEKITSAAPAVESLLKATAKIAGGPKGYGDKGQGYKLSPLLGKPPIPMAGMGVGPGMGGFGTQTKGLGAVRGMGGNGGGVGVFTSGGVGKGKVAGTVVSAPARKARISGGSLAREEIAKVINAHMNEVRGCYERALLKDAGLSGKLQLEWTIDTSGRVSEIKVKTSTIKGSQVPDCIVNSLKTWAFPAPKGGRVVVSYPFLFNAVGF